VVTFRKNIVIVRMWGRFGFETKNIIELNLYI